ncbi:MAG: hypothetical protein ABI690_25445 [Chloroflexota bacterium]
MIRASRFKIVSLFIVVGCLISAQLAGVAPTAAATIDKISVTCKWVALRGKTEVRAPYVRVQAVLGSDLTQVLATQVVPTAYTVGANYYALLDISGAHLADGTLVVVAAGEWDGAHYLKPATITSRNCNKGSATPTPPPVSATPTFVASATFPPTPFPTLTPLPMTPSRTPFVPSATPSPITRTPLPVTPSRTPPTIFPSLTPTFVPSYTPSPISPPSTPTPPPY